MSNRKVKSHYRKSKKGKTSLVRSFLRTAAIGTVGAGTIGGGIYLLKKGKTNNPPVKIVGLLPPSKKEAIRLGLKKNKPHYHLGDRPIIAKGSSLTEKEVKEVKGLYSRFDNLNEKEFDRLRELNTLASREQADEIINLNKRKSIQADTRKTRSNRVNSTKEYKDYKSALAKYRNIETFNLNKINTKYKPDINKLQNDIKNAELEINKILKQKSKNKIAIRNIEFDNRLKAQQNKINLSNNQLSIIEDKKVRDLNKAMSKPKKELNIARTALKNKSKSIREGDTKRQKERGIDFDFE